MVISYLDKIVKECGKGHEDVYAKSFVDGYVSKWCNNIFFLYAWNTCDKRRRCCLARGDSAEELHVWADLNLINMFMKKDVDHHG